MPQDTFASAQGTRFLQQSSPAVSGGWWVLVIVIIVLLLGIAGVLLWQRKRTSPFRSRGVRASCQLCGRERRVPPELISHLDDFVCRDCVRAAFPEMNESQPREFPAGSSEFLDDETVPPPISEEEMRRRDRLSAMKRAKSQTFKIKRMTSTFFRVRSDEDPLPVGKSKSSLDIDDLACDENDGTCKVCFEEPATIVLLPCGHGGLCQGCAKELVLSGKPCYICGEEFHMIAELKAKSMGGQDDDGDDATAGKERFIGKLIRPDSLHHSKSAAPKDSSDDSGSPPSVPNSPPTSAPRLTPALRQNTAPAGASNAVTSSALTSL
mmetsp:Transcript_19250/g.16484  ORF Transcript_19250/g.16484 Transcript_19250/m.16484 type:complete len:323 (-) Transcript_19250:111-1079(-)